MGGWITLAGLNGMINERRLQRVLSLLRTSRDTSGSPPLTHTHTHTADIIINNGGTMGLRATIANTARRLGGFTAGLDVRRYAAFLHVRSPENTRS